VTDTTIVTLFADFTEGERQPVMARFAVLQPTLEDGMPLNPDDYSLI
jgi:hypothetical protein